MITVSKILLCFFFTEKKNIFILFTKKKLKNTHLIITNFYIKVFTKIILMTSHFSQIITPTPEGLFYKTRRTMIITRKKKRLVFNFFFNLKNIKNIKIVFSISSKFVINNNFQFSIFTFENTTINK